MAKNSDFDCEDFLRCLSDYLDGELDEDIRIRVEQHMRGCSDARCFAATFRKTIRLHQETGTPEVPSDVHDRLLEAVRRCAHKFGRS